MSTVAVHPYSSEWPVLFRGVREELLALFAPTAVVVEHIGSTAVPGLAAKPVIDVLLGASSLAAVEYETLKLRLAQELADDKSAYAAAKGPFIRSVLSTVCPPREAGRPVQRRR